jgi:hypothetical protein
MTSRRSLINDRHGEEVMGRSAAPLSSQKLDEALAPFANTIKDLIGDNLL